MKKGPRLVLEHNIIFQLLSDEHFWELVPEFADLREEGEEHLAQASKVLRGKKCNGCSTLKAVLKPFTEKFTLRIASLFEYDKTRLTDLRNYVADKLGYRPKEILVYYKDLSGRTNQVRF